MIIISYHLTVKYLMLFAVEVLLICVHESPVSKCLVCLMKLLQGCSTVKCQQRSSTPLNQASVSLCLVVLE